MAGAPTRTNRLADRIRRHRVRIFRVAEGVSAGVQRELAGVRVDLVKLLSAADPTEPARLGDKLNRIDAATAEARATVGKRYRKIKRRTERATVEVVVADQKAMQAMVARAADYSVDVVPERVIERIAERALVEGAPLADWWRRQAADVVKRFHDQVRQGTQAGESIGQLITRIRGTGEKDFADGIMAVTQRQAEALVRTSVMSTINDTHEHQLRQNSDVVRGRAVLVTFDDRTCEVCMGFSGAIYDHDGEPLPESPVQQPLPSAGLPMHVSCRCIWSPVLVGEAPPEDMSYEAWLTAQPAAEQRAILGPKWYAAWKAGDVASLRARIDQRGRPISLKQFRKEAA